MDDVEIHWPSGAVEHAKLSGVDRFYSVEEGKGVASDPVGSAAVFRGATMRLQS